MTLSTFPINSIYDVIATITGSYQSPIALRLSRLINPTNDRILDEIHTLQFSLWQQLRIHGAEITALQTKLTPMERDLRQSQFDLCLDLFESLRTLELNRSFEIAFPKQGEAIAESLGLTALLATIKPGVPVMENPDEWKEHLAFPPSDWIQWDFEAVDSLYAFLLSIPVAYSPTTNVVQRFLSNRLKALPLSEDQLWQITPELPWKHQRFQQELLAGFNSLLFDLHLRRPDNVLKGVAGRSRLLLIDSLIPLPTVESFLGWAALCQQWWDPKTDSGVFLLPILPLTHEYGGYSSAVGADDSHFDHSLPARSNGHKRNLNGAIQPGIGYWLEVKNGKIVYGSHTSGDKRHAMMLARHRQRYVTTSSLPLPHPFMSDGTLISTNVMTLCTEQMDLRFRAMAKTHRIHFRFDSWAHADIWIDRYIDIAMEYHAMTHEERQKMRLQEVVNHRIPHMRQQQSNQKGKVDLAGIEALFK